MPHEKHPPKGCYRVVVHLSGEWTNVDHNLGGRRAFELVEQWRTEGYSANYVSQNGEHSALAANTCPDCARSLSRWQRRQAAKLGHCPTTIKTPPRKGNASADSEITQALSLPNPVILSQASSLVPTPQSIQSTQDTPSLSTVCQGNMIATVWTNGSTELGLKIRGKDRDQFFQKEWAWVSLELEGLRYPVEISISKPSFWRWGYAQLVSRDLGDWITANGMAYWPPRKPPKLKLELIGDRRFRLMRQRLSVAGE